MKRLMCLLLCLVLLLPLLAAGARAEETPELIMVRINPGNGICVESAIFSEGEIYIPAENFARYTRYRFHPDSSTFLIAGQEARKAMKKIVISPEKKSLAVGTELLKLSDCFTVDGVLYLPFCQLLPILNAEILAVEDGVILVSNRDLSMAELLYDFDLSDYAYDLNAEFLDSEGLLLGYTIPSYLFDSVTNFRFDRLDFIADSGAYKDYREIFEGYLKDDALFLQAADRHDDAGTILRLVTGLTGESEKLHNAMEWLEKAEQYSGSLLADDDLVKLFQDGEVYSDYFGSYDVNIFTLTDAAHSDAYGLSFADTMEILEYAYTYFNHVEDHFRMLDAVYDFSAGEDFSDTQRRGARAVYDLYGGRELDAMIKQTAEKLFENALEESRYGSELLLYKLAAKVSGELWELAIPGDTEDISTLTLHAGIASTAMAKAGAGSFETEESTTNYRLSLLLMMLASRKAYEIMADTASAYGENDAAYRAKIRKLEAMIQGLYLVAGNVRLDTYEYFDDYARDNRKLLEDAGLFDDPQPVTPDAMIGPEERVYLDFLAQHPEYRYFALVDINQDGCMELLASEDNGYPHSYIDLWIWQGDFRLGWEDIWAKYDPIAYSPTNRWIVTQVGGTGGMGYWFYSLDETLTVRKQGVEYYDFCGYLYNDQPVTDEAMMEAWNKLSAMHDPDTCAQIDFSPVPSGW